MADRLITELTGHSIVMAEAEPMKVDYAQKASAPPMLPSVYWFHS